MARFYYMSTRKCRYRHLRSQLLGLLICLQALVGAYSPLVSNKPTRELLSLVGCILSTVLTSGAASATKLRTSTTMTTNTTVPSRLRKSPRVPSLRTLQTAMPGSQTKLSGQLNAAGNLESQRKTTIRIRTARTLRVRMMGARKRVARRLEPNHYHIRSAHYIVTDHDTKITTLYKVYDRPRHFTKFMTDHDVNDTTKITLHHEAHDRLACHEVHGMKPCQQRQRLLMTPPTTL